jgi:DNA-binding response OmpR family regulator
MSQKILTIEDTADIRRLIRMTLEFQGYEVIEASEGVQGLNLARSQKPDLILLDVMMPGIDGLDVARQLSDDPLLRRIPVIMLSAMGAASDIRAGLQAGVKAYLVKPFSPRELLDKVSRLLESASGAKGAAPA